MAGDLRNGSGPAVAATRSRRMRETHCGPKVHSILEDREFLQAMGDAGYLREPLPTPEELD